jgi:mutator protein MutT
MKAEMNRERVGVAVVILQEGRVLGVSRKHDHSDFGLPGGKVEQGEEPEEAALREVREETGLEVGSLWEIFRQERSSGTAIGYLAEEWKGEIGTEEPHVVKWCEWEELEKGSFGEFNRRTRELLEGKA